MTTVKSARQVGAFIRAERERARLTQAQLAARAGVSRRWLIATERGEHPRAEVDRLLHVLAALDVSVTLAGPAAPMSASPPRRAAGVTGAPAASVRTPRPTSTTPTTPTTATKVDLDSHLARFRH